MSLPRDPDRLIEIIVDLQQRNAHLQGIVAALKRAVYGPRSEKLPGDGAQLQLGLPGRFGRRYSIGSTSSPGGSAIATFLLGFRDRGFDCEAGRA